MRRPMSKYDYPQQSRIPESLQGWKTRNESVRMPSGKIADCKRIYVQNMNDNIGIMVTKDARYRVKNVGEYWDIISAWRLEEASK